ncbi:MAG: hypothetical protein ABI741_14810 [Ferruginibacter sp.]
MRTTDIILAALAGTTTFTAFSYLVSKKMDKDFEEPELLGKMVEVIPGMEEKEAAFTGWAIHYLTGIVFASSFKALISITGMKPTIRNGMIVGAASGLPAALAWDKALRSHPSPPRKPSMNYYMHLALGHVIFGATSFFVFGLFNKNR